MDPVEENKLEVGTHLEYIYDLLKSDSFLWKEYALSTIVNCTTERKSFFSSQPKLNLY